MTESLSGQETFGRNMPKHQIKKDGIRAFQHLGPSSGKDKKPESEQKSPSIHGIPPDSQALSITVLLSSTLPPADAHLVNREGIRKFTPWAFLLNFFQCHHVRAIKGDSLRDKTNLLKSLSVFLVQRKKEEIRKGLLAKAQRQFISNSNFSSVSGNYPPTRLRGQHPFNQRIG